MEMHYFILAMRRIRNDWWISALTILALAVGVSATMTSQLVIRMLDADPLPGRSQSLFYVRADPQPASEDEKPLPDMLDYRTATDLWSLRGQDRGALVADGSMSLQDERGKALIDATFLATTSDFFTLFRTRFRFGSAWSSADEQRLVPSVVISDRLNEVLFHGGNSVGRMLRVDGRSLQVVGVLAPWRPSPRFYLMAGGHDGGANASDVFGPAHDLYIPMPLAKEIALPHMSWFTCWGQLRSPSQLATAPCLWVGLWVQASTDADRRAYSERVSAYVKSQLASGRFTRGTRPELIGLTDWIAYNNVIPRDVRLQSWLSYGLFIVCLINIGGLLFVRFSGRRSEIALRRALGATQASIAWQCTAESLVVGLIGAALGMLLTTGATSYVRSLPTAYANLIHLGAVALAVTVAVALVAALIASIIPTVLVARQAPGQFLKE
ncbi:ABC transporter permease [Luteibacter sahnii]|uniref:ABC transporter permease n=1 Tax=Luteibacter sahnii TaxID=3021977 RepID=UPI002A6A9FCA|nr:ABC transporter permease [Luteibacter sp. PPL193]MDY1549574.1 ABC transporter permease [Luteibacter sp. PPL193]